MPPDTHWQIHTHTHTCTCIYIYTHILKTILYSLRGDREALSLLHFLCSSFRHSHTQRGRERIKPILRGFRVHQDSIEISDQIHFDMLDMSSTTVAMVTRWSTVAHFYSGCVTKGQCCFTRFLSRCIWLSYFFSYCLTTSCMFEVMHVPFARAFASIRSAVTSEDVQRAGNNARYSDVTSESHAKESKKQTNTERDWRRNISIIINEHLNAIAQINFHWYPLKFL